MRFALVFLALVSSSALAAPSLPDVPMPELNRKVNARATVYKYTTVTRADGLSIGSRVNVCSFGAQVGLYDITAMKAGHQIPEKDSLGSCNVTINGQTAKVEIKAIGWVSQSWDDVIRKSFHAFFTSQVGEKKIELYTNAATATLSEPNLMLSLDSESFGPDEFKESIGADIDFNDAN
jgi:hypothetical protein